AEGAEKVTATNAESLEKAASQSPAHPRASEWLYRAADLHRQAGQWERALAVYRRPARWQALQARNEE
ncbi:MAG: hypothetical protein AAB654_00040, partial [Acidobacteriota bacterium]